MKKKPAKEKQDRSDPMSNIHVRLLEPRHIRKTVIAAAIEAIELIRKSDAYLELQKQKNSVRSELAEVMKDIKSLVRDLKASELPKLPEEKAAEKVKKTIQKEMEAETPEEHAEPSRPEPAAERRPAPKLGGIESELEELRRRLSEI